MKYLTVGLHVLLTSVSMVSWPGELTFCTCSPPLWIVGYGPSRRLHGRDGVSPDGGPCGHTRRIIVARGDTEALAERGRPSIGGVRGSPIGSTNRDMIDLLASTATAWKEGKWLAG